MLGEVEITIVTAARQVVEPLPSAAANPLCAGAQTKNDGNDEDPQSLGFLARFGSFEFVDLGDLTWGVEHRLACPMNRIGQVEIFQSSQHGSTESNPPQLVHALAPLAIVVNNGASKGGEPRRCRCSATSPGMKDVWQVHRANAAGANNTEDALIANTGGADQAHWIRATHRGRAAPSRSPTAAPACRSPTSPANPPSLPHPRIRAPPHVTPCVEGSGAQGGEEGSLPRGREEPGERLRSP